MSDTDSDDFLNDSNKENEEEEGETTNAVTKQLESVLQAKKNLQQMKSVTANYKHGFEGVTASRVRVSKSQAHPPKNASQPPNPKPVRSKRKHDTGTNGQHAALAKKTRTSTADNVSVDAPAAESLGDGDSLLSKLWKYRRHSKTGALLQYFDIDGVNDGAVSNSDANKNVTFKCKICKQELGGTIGNNSNLTRHLEQVCTVNVHTI